MAMLTLTLVAVFATSLTMTMCGRGGGNFCVPILVFCGFPSWTSCAEI